MPIGTSTVVTSEEMCSSRSPRAPVSPSNKRHRLPTVCSHCAISLGRHDVSTGLEDVVVHPAHRSKSVASPLLGELERMGRDAGRKQVILLTESVREDAVALYRAAGYENRWTGFKMKL